jgi:RNA polymerase sigma-70 factor (ECF subfamily)
LDERSDKNLVAASQAGDKTAYALLVKRYYKQVFLVSMGVLGNVHDAEDVAQDAMLKGFLQIRRLRDADRFGPWIVKIAKNMCLNVARKRKRTKAFTEERTSWPEQPAAENDNLQRAIQKLPKDMRLPLVMYYFDDQSVKAVAEKLNVSASGVYVKLRTATKKLHELLVSQGDMK